MARDNISVRVSQQDLKRIQKKLGRMPATVQKKVTRVAIRDTLKEVVWPETIRRINARSTEVPMLPYRKRGLSTAMQSHTSAPGALKRAMGKAWGKRRKALKRSRVRVGYALVSPTREELDIPEDYPGYYPAFLEFQKSPLGNAPSPFMRGTFARKKPQIMGSMVRKMKSGIQREYAS